MSLARDNWKSGKMETRRRESVVGVANSRLRLMDMERADFPWKVAFGGPKMSSKVVIFRFLFRDGFYMMFSCCFWAWGDENVS